MKKNLGAVQLVSSAGGSPDASGDPRLDLVRIAKPVPKPVVAMLCRRAFSKEIGWKRK